MLLSLYGVTPMDSLNWLLSPLRVKLRESPPLCTAKLSDIEKELELTRIVVHDFDIDLLKYSDSDGQEVGGTYHWACHQVIEPGDVYRNRSLAVFKLQCCMKIDDANQALCRRDTFSSKILHTILVILCIAAFLLGPLLIPTWACHTAQCYAVCLKKPLRKSLWITRSRLEAGYPTAVKTLDLRHVDDTRPFAKCRRISSQLETDRKLNITVSCCDIEVDDNELLTERHSPVNIAHFLVNLFLQCNAAEKHDDQADKCSSACAQIGHVVGRVTLAVLIPVPYYACAVLRYVYEYPELERRRQVATYWDMVLPEDVSIGFHPTSVIHVTACAVFLVTSVALVCVRNTRVFGHAYEVVATALVDMRTGSVAANMNRALGKSPGLHGRRGVAARVFRLALVPVTFAACLVYRIPMVLLCCRVVSHVVTLGPASDYTRLGEREQRNGLRGKRTCQRLAVILLILALFSSLMTLLSAVVCYAAKFLWIMLIIMIIGINIYVTTPIALAAHAYDCYSRVYRKYKHLNRAIFTELESQLQHDVDDIQQHADSSNLAFKIGGGVSGSDDIIVNGTNGPPTYQWDVGNVLLFLDASNYPRIPRKLFLEICQKVAASGRRNPLGSFVTATVTFVGRAFFVAFVYTAVCALGEWFDMMSTRQLITAFTISVLPIAQKFLLKKPVDVSPFVRFKCAAKKVVSKYRETWPMADLRFEVDSTIDVDPVRALHGSGEADGSNVDVDLLILISEEEAAETVVMESTT